MFSTATKQKLHRSLKLSSLNDPLFLLLTLSTVAIYLIWGTFRAYWAHHPELQATTQLWSSLFVGIAILGATISHKISMRFLAFAMVLSLIPYPVIPHLYFVRGLGFLVLWVMFIKYSISLIRKDHLTEAISSLDPFIQLMGLFFVSYLATIVFHMMEDDVSAYYAKYSLSWSAVYLTFIFLLVLSTQKNEATYHKRILMDSLVACIWFTIAVGTTALVISLHHQDLFNDTGLGLLYYDRVKGTFFGPDMAGVFYLAAISVMMLYSYITHHVVKRKLCIVAIGLLYLLIFASGSRGCKLVAPIPLLWGLSVKEFRTITLPIIPIALALYLYGLFDQSIFDMLHHSPLYHHHFSIDPIRQGEILKTITQLKSSSLTTVLLGSATFDTGEGFDNSGVAILIHQGIIGLTIFGTAIVELYRRLSNVIKQGSRQLQLKAQSIMVSISVIALCSLVHNTHTYLFSWYYIATALSIIRFSESSRQVS